MSSGLVVLDTASAVSGSEDNLDHYRASRVLMAELIDMLSDPITARDCIAYMEPLDAYANQDPGCNACDVRMALSILHGFVHRLECRA